MRCKEGAEGAESSERAGSTAERAGCDAGNIMAEAKRKKQIAVVPLWDEERKSIWMLPGYMEGIEEAGAVPVILPYTDNLEDVLQIFSLCSGLLITGGQDVNPAMYHAEKSSACGECCKARDKMDAALYSAALREDKPVLGICRGIQIINVLQGGTLYQDLPSEFKNNTEHQAEHRSEYRPVQLAKLQAGHHIEHHMKPPYTAVAHYVDIAEGTGLYSLLKDLLQDKIQDDLRDEPQGAPGHWLGVNSYHHQAVKDIGRDLDIMAVSEDGLVEAVALKGKRFVWGIQWHPEFSFRTDEASRRIFRAFVDAC